MTPPPPESSSPPLPEAPALAFVRELGTGASSRVELCVLEEPFAGRGRGSEIAAKRPVDPSDPNLLRTFASEARVGSSVRGPGLVRVHGLYRDQRGPLLLLDYVAGESLREALEARGALPEPLVRHVGRQLAGALRVLHAAGFVHGDVKPENVRLDEHGDATLLDLGFARGIGDTDRPAAGSLPYLSPERRRGGPPSVSADVFALGVLLYELLCVRRPFEAPESGYLGDSGSQLEVQDLESAERLGEWLPPSRHAPRTSPLLDAFLAALLDPRPAARPSAEGAFRILHEGEGGPWWRQRVHNAQESSELWISVRGHRFPLVGRGAELAEMDRARMESGPEAKTGRILCLHGAAGSGKSRLFDAFLGRAREAGAPPLVLTVRISENAESRPFGSLSRLLRRYLQLPDEARPTERDSRALRRLLPPHDAGVLLGALDVSSTEPLDGSVSLSLARLIARISRQRATIVVFDDVQRARLGTLHGLERLADELSKGPGLLLLGIDSEMEPASPAGLTSLRQRLKALGDAVVTDLELRPIDQDAVLELTTRMFHHTAPRLRLAKVLWERSRGHAGFLIEILDALVEHDRVRPASETDPRWLLLESPESLPLPDSFQASLRERYGRLEPSVRHWLERIAVVGGRIEPDFLARTFQPSTRPEIDGVLSELVNLGWLEPFGDRFRFTRPALRDAVYRALPADRRRRLHERAARGLAEEGAAESAPVFAYQRVFHLRASDNPAQVLAELPALLKIVAGRGSPRRVQRLADWGLEAIASLPQAERPEELELQLLELAADAADRSGDRRSMRRLLDRLAQRDVESKGDPVATARAFLLHARGAALVHQTKLHHQLLREAVRLGALARRPDIESEAHRRIARALSSQGEFTSATQHAGQAMDRAEAPEQQAAASFVQALIAVLQDRPEDALDALGEGSRLLAGEATHERLGLLAGAWLVRARALRSVGRVQRALAAATRSLELCRRSGDRRFESEAQSRVGALLAEAGRPEDAETALREARLVALETEDGRGLCLAEIGLGVVLSEASDPEASAAFHRGLASSRAAGFARGEAVALALGARADLQSGERLRADENSRLAFEISKRVGAELFDRVTIVATRALVLDRLGFSADSKQLVRDLERDLAQFNRTLRSPGLRASQRTYARELLELSLSEDGPLAPRR